MAAFAGSPRRRVSLGQSLSTVSAGTRSTLQRKEEEEEQKFALRPLPSLFWTGATRSTDDKQQLERQKVIELARNAATFIHNPMFQTIPSSSSVLAYKLLSVVESTQWQLTWILHFPTPPEFTGAASEQPQASVLRKVLQSVSSMFDEAMEPDSIIRGVIEHFDKQWLAGHYGIRPSIAGKESRWISVLALMNVNVITGEYGEVLPLTAALGKAGDIDHLVSFEESREQAVRLSIVTHNVRPCQLLMTLLLNQLKRRYAPLELLNMGGISGCICYVRAATAAGLRTFVRNLDRKRDKPLLLQGADECSRINTMRPLERFSLYLQFVH